MLETIIKTLNAPQKEAVLHDRGSVLVLAGAGSGKTRVLTTRIGRLLIDRLATPGSVLAVTFTNKAAKEMLIRISSMVPYDLRGVWIGTFHGLCHRLLRLHHNDAGLAQGFQIMDMQDQIASIKRLLKSLNVDSEVIIPKELQRFINNAKEQGLRPNDIEDTNGFNRQYIELYEAYDSQCQREGVVDFGELLLRSVELLQRHNELRHHYQTRFQHILIDEFQDTNALQYKWLSLLTGEESSVFAVGDDDQSIYAFRGADVSNMARFEKDFGVEKIIRLEQNYRSHGHILDAANALIQNNINRLGKNLWTDSESGDQIKVNECVDDTYEADWVVGEVKTFISEEISPSEIAILYRSNAQSRVIEHTLSKIGIKYRVYGGFRFYDRAEIKNALAYLRLVANSDDDNALLRVINFPPRKIGSKTVENLQRTAREKDCSLFSSIDFIEGKNSKSLSGFRDLIEQIKKETCDLSLPDVISQTLKISGLIEHYSEDRESVDRLENLRELINAGEAFLVSERIAKNVPANLGVVGNTNGSRKSGDEILSQQNMEIENVTPLTGFISNATLDSGESQAEAGEEAVQLMTIHAAKGLEFEKVFVVGLEEGLFPHENSLNEFGGLDEERRLMYVAITRAKRSLYFSYAQMRKLYGQFRYNRKSRFLDEVPEEHLRWLSSTRTRKSIAELGTSEKGKNIPFSETKKMSLAFDSIAEGQMHDKNGSVFLIGRTVRHKRFGDGVILRLEGHSNESRAEVRFSDGTTKWLSLSVAKLEVV